jgi:hypothetical protein
LLYESLCFKQGEPPIPFRFAIGEANQGRIGLRKRSLLVSTL